MARLLLRLSLVALALAMALTVALQLRMPRELVEVFALPDDVAGLPLGGPAPGPTTVSPSAPPATPTQSPPATDRQKTTVLQQGRDGYSGCSDTYLQFYRPDENYCDSGELYVVTTDKAATLIRFDLTRLPGPIAGLDSSAVVVQATLELYAVQGNKGVELGLYLPRGLWDPCTVSWSRPWEKAGANGLSDRESGPFQNVSTKSDPQWIEFDVTALVQYWLREPQGNFGMLIKSFESAVPSHHIFFSSENGDPESRPRLTIRYEPALPTPPPETVSPTEAAPSSTPFATPTVILAGSPRVVEVHWWNQMEVGNTYPVKLVFRPRATVVDASSFDVYVLGVKTQLSAATFEVEAASTLEQVLTGPEASLLWSWTVQPRFVGEQSVSLDMAFDWTPAVLEQPRVLTEPSAWYQIRMTRVNESFPYWSLLQAARQVLVAAGLLGWIGWFALRKRPGQP
jgi:hypothetical protein